MAMWWTSSGSKPTSSGWKSIRTLFLTTGDGDGIDQFRAYLGGMTSNVARFEKERLDGGRLAIMLFSLNYFAGRQPIRSGQLEVFRGASGLNVYSNPEAFPRLWTAHQVFSTTTQDLISRLQSADLRRQVFLSGAGPTLELCSNTDDVQLVHRTATRVVFDAHMACKGMIILSQTFFPGWEACVDGHQAHLYEAYGVLQGVVVDGGSRRIEVRYRPLAVYLGGVLTTLGLVAALLLALPRAPFRLRGRGIMQRSRP
jgi:hypothetical protein